MSDHGFNYAERRYIPISTDTATALQVRAGDFFISRGNGSLRLVGRGTLAQEPLKTIVFPDTMIRARLSGPQSIGRFVDLIWGSRLVGQQIEKKARTTADIFKISQEDVKGFAIPLPPADEQQVIVAEVEQRLSIVASTEARIESNLKRAARLRQSILREAFAGRLVPQDPAEEPACVLLERLRVARNDKQERARNKRGTRRPPEI